MSEILEWLSTLRLPQYFIYFDQGGYETLDDCKELSDERLLELGVIPTGHRRRILRSLEALGVVLSEDERDDEESGRRRRKPVPNPRTVFRENRGVSYLHSQTSERRQDGLKGSQTLPPGAGLRRENDEEGTGVGHPLPAPRDPQNIGLCYAPCPPSSTDSSSDSFSITETPSDWEVFVENPVLPDTKDAALAPAEVPQTLPEEEFPCEMVENSIYESQPGVVLPKGPRPTRSYRLRHRPVPEIPSLVILPDLIQDRSAPLTQAPSPEHLTGSEGPTGANGIQKDLDKTLTPIVPYGETFLYNNPDSAPDQSDKDGLQKGLKNKIKPKKLRKKPAKKTEDKAAPPPPQTNQPPDMDDYSTVEECSRILSYSTADTAPGGTSEDPGAAPPQDRSMGAVVECELYSLPADALGGTSKDTLPDISPYACFYGAPQCDVFKAGWLDKLSPQG